MLNWLQAKWQQISEFYGDSFVYNVKNMVGSRVFHKNTFSKKKIVHTLTTPYRAYINHTQKIFFLGQV